MLLVAVAAIHFARYYSELPPVVASHFDARGVANGWQTKQAFFAIFAGVTVLTCAIVFCAPLLIAMAPASLINLPNKNYWLAPERRAASQAFISAWFGWFGCVMFLLMILTFDYAIKWNLHQAADPTRLWYEIGGFGAFSLVWMLYFLLRFYWLPHDISDAR